MNALCLPPALEFNRAARAGGGRRASARRSAATQSSACASWLGSAASTGSATSASPRTTCRDVAAAASERKGNLANPRPASPEEIEAMLRSIW